jgi:hypothetical protein
MAKSFVNPVYSGAYSRAVNRAAAGVLSRKKKKIKKKSAKSVRHASPRQITQHNPVARRSVSEQVKRTNSEVPLPVLPSPHQARPAVPSTKAIAKESVQSCAYCGEQIENLADHIRKVHGTEKYVKWLLSRCETPHRAR